MSEVNLGEMPSHGNASFNELAAAVAEAVIGNRDHEFEFEHENLFIGHQIVPTINFNSLNRIVTAFVNGSAAPPVSDLRDENERLRKAIKRLMLGYVSTMESGRDRIMSLGGACDPVDVMEASDPHLIEARAVLQTEGK